MKGHHKLIAVLAAGAFVVAGAPAVATAAAPAPTASAAKVSTAQLNKRISAARKDLKRYGRLISQLRRGSGGATGDRTRLGRRIDGIISALATLDTSLKGTQGTLAGVISIAGTALPALQNGLVTLGSAYQSVEYGVVGITVGNAAGIANASAVSPDVPDDGNPARATGSAFFTATTNVSSTVGLFADIRSNEGDNTASTPAGTGPVGQAGGLVQVRNNATGALVGCTGAPAYGIFGTTAGEAIVTPSGTVTTLPLKNIVNGKLRTDTTAPSGTSTALLPAGCTFATTAGVEYTVHYEGNFVDIPTTTTPGPRD